MCDHQISKIIETTNLWSGNCEKLCQTQIWLSFPPPSYALSLARTHWNVLVFTLWIHYIWCQLHYEFSKTNWIYLHSHELRKRGKRMWSRHSGSLPQALLTVRLNPCIIIHTLICFFVSPNSCFLKSPERNSNLRCTKMYIMLPTCCIFIHAQAAVSFEGIGASQGQCLSKTQYESVRFPCCSKSESGLSWVARGEFAPFLLTCFH